MSDYASDRRIDAIVSRASGKVLLSYAQFAEVLQVKHGTVKRWRHEGMPVTETWAGPRVDPSAAREWIRKHARQSTIGRQPTIYFAQRPDGAIKIGFCGDVERRMLELRKRARGLVLLATMPGDKRTELRLHKAFASSALGEEWFSPSDALLSFISPLVHA
jgi:hypothetical protein